MRLLGFVAAAIVVVSAQASAEVVRVSIASRAAVAGGQAFGSTGAYEKLSGTIEFAIDPADPHDAVIADIGLAPRAADGRVHFTADLFVLKPVDATKGNGTLLFEISNRGGKGLLRRFNRAPASADPSAAADFGDGFLMREGYTLVWVGWEFDVAAGLRVDAPLAALPGGQPAAPIAVRFTLDGRANETPLRDAPLYPPATIAAPDATLTVRDTFWARPTVVDRGRWRFVTASPPTLALDGGFEPGRLYEVTYAPSGARVAGLGLAAIRDAASAFRYRDDLPVRGRSAIVFGISQSGRFLRQFLYDGFNADARDRKVFDAVWPHIAGAARGSFNERFATPTSLSAFVGTQPPFTDGDRLGRGLLTRYRPDQRPKVFHTNTSVEYWGNGRAAAAIHTTDDGRSDLALPGDVRAYLLAGTQHGEASFPPQGGNGQFAGNPTPQGNVMRALLRALRQWVADGVLPPDSRYPRIADGTLTPVAGFRFPAIAGVRDPRTIPGPGVLGPDGTARMLPFLVPQVDADGNELAGIRVPELAVPLATTTGWNFRAESVGNPADIYSLLGAYIPFAATKSGREARSDSRLSVDERYRSRDDYLQRIGEAARDLVRARLLLGEDLDDVLTRAAAHWEYATRPAAVSSR